MIRPLILIGNYAKPGEDYDRERASGLIPRLDYMEIARCVDGIVSGYANGANVLHKLQRSVERALKIDFLEAWGAFDQADRYSGILSTSEKQGIPLAFFMQNIRRRRDDCPPICHVVIAHRLSTFNKNLLFHLSSVQQYFTHLICVSKAQADYAIEKLGMPANRVSFIYDKADHTFFQPMDGTSRLFILAVGQEQRDYNALVKAIEGTNIQLVIVASSPWSTFDVHIKKYTNVTLINNITYQLLKSLYAQAHLVVLPLNEVNYAAGVTTLMESMSMAKPIVVSKTFGLQDYIFPGETVSAVSCGDVAELRDAIFSLWDNTRRRRELGANARSAILENMNMDLYVNNVSQILLQACSSVTG